MKINANQYDFCLASYVDRHRHPLIRVHGRLIVRTKQARPNSFNSPNFRFDFLGILYFLLNECECLAVAGHEIHNGVQRSSKENSQGNWLADFIGRDNYLSK
ncbi:hypothetical protein ACFOLJ_18210 [Rugamonas sp. CCM 8940]|uniref:hypothetical protein n=1 Tax=Rugamonas sp. CCM 8940 TaxID=2765359 RepID=UPI0018F3A5A1|nr:hypothetical protein [Rugamonas sp. CCM 8940]MBJ7313518.1 hypothetical protein [Rugamonas sp. CCM 8940]